ncbi:MAG: lysylphosphatidylglycerol synthase transmembrane domain-containing protein [Gemmatimonadota bacterium]
MSRPGARRAAFRIGGSVLVLALLLAFLPREELWEALRGVPIAVWPAALGAYLALHLLGVAKWRRLVNSAGGGLSWAGAVRCYYLGLFGNVFLPSLVGGDVVRAGLALRLSPSRSGVLLGSLVDRMLDVVALAGLAAAGALLAPGTVDPKSRTIFRVLAAGAAVGGLALAAAAMVIRARWFSRRMRERLVHARRAVRALSRQPQDVLLAFGSGVLLQGLQVVLNAWIGEACGLHLPAAVWLFAWPLAKLSALVPVTQGGIGVREAALAALLAPFGAPAVLAVAVGLAFEAVVITGGLISGVISLLLGRSSGAVSGAAATARAWRRGPDPAIRELRR